MTTVQIAIPVLKGSRRFIVERGRRWSVIEHLLLDSLSKGAASSSELSERSSLPRRVIIEAFFRLMRAGWVEIVATTKGAQFQITSVGRERVDQDPLPSATVTEPRWRGFAVEQVTGSVFRSRELDLIHKNQLPMRGGATPCVILDAKLAHSIEEMSEVFTAIEGEDEIIVGVDRGPEKLAERYALVTVRENEIDGLPARAPMRLRQAIFEAALRAQTDASDGSPARTSISLAPDENREAKNISAAYDPSDLIVDGPEHWESFKRIIAASSRRLIIHSTFVSSERADSILPLLLKAAERGVKVDVLWGQDDVGSSTRTSQTAAAKLQAAVDAAGRTESITIHPFSTNSHAKVIIADSTKGWSALLGSCNWLASDYGSFETSFRIREPYLVGMLIRKLAGLAQWRAGVWNDFAIELTVLGRRVMELQPLKGRKVPMRLVYGAEHAELVLEARDRAERRIFALSHRIGIAAESVALLPALAAVNAKSIEASFFYGRTTGPLSGEAGSGLVRSFNKAGLKVRPVHRPRIHAKVLGWDNDCLAISSLNWLSADPSAATPCREIGILVNAPQIADNFITRFEASMS